LAGLGVRLFTDEMIDPALAVALRQRGYDVESCREAHRHNQKIPDEDQLDYATSQGRAILTFNVGDFYQREADWKAVSRAHYGIIVSSEVTELGTLLRLVQEHLDTCTPTMQYDSLLWLGSVTSP
jgi:hypothetical protein